MFEKPKKGERIWKGISTPGGARGARGARGAWGARGAGGRKDANGRFADYEGGIIYISILDLTFEFVIRSSPEDHNKQDENNMWISPKIFG